jgi:hypothetical protein
LKFLVFTNIDIYENKLSNILQFNVNYCIIKSQLLYYKGKPLNSIEFKTEIVKGIIKVPQEYKDFQNAHVLLSITLKSNPEVSPPKEVSPKVNPKAKLEDKVQTLDFSECEVTCFKDINPVDYQRKIRDAK